MQGSGQWLLLVSDGAFGLLTVGALWWHSTPLRGGAISIAVTAGGGEVLRDNAESIRQGHLFFHLIICHFCLHLPRSMLLFTPSTRRADVGRGGRSRGGVRHRPDSMQYARAG